MGFCKICGKPIRNDYVYCYACYQIGNSYVDGNGYERYKDSDKLVHRYNAEKKLGRKLRKSEVVHHKNRNKLDNDPENLWVFRNQAEHDRIHEFDAQNHGRRASYKGFLRNNKSWFETFLSKLF